MKRLLCLIGLHDWRLVATVQIESSHTDVGPMDYECGGEDYYLQCRRCEAKKIDRVRGVWLPRNYRA